MLSKDGFVPLLVLVAARHPVIEKLELDDKQIRMALIEGAEAIITKSKLRRASHRLELEPPLSETLTHQLKEQTKILSRLQTNLLQRVSSPPEDIRNR